MVFNNKYIYMLLVSALSMSVRRKLRARLATWAIAYLITYEKRSMCEDGRDGIRKLEDVKPAQYWRPISLASHPVQQY